MKCRKYMSKMLLICIYVIINCISSHADEIWFHKELITTDLRSLNMCFKTYLIKKRFLSIRHSFVLSLRVFKHHNVRCVNSELKICFQSANLSVFETLLIYMWFIFMSSDSMLLMIFTAACICLLQIILLSIIWNKWAKILSVVCFHNVIFKISKTVSKMILRL